MNRTKISIILLIFLAVLVRLCFFIKADNFEGSVTMGRVIDALNIIDNPKLSVNFDGNASVFYNYFLAAILRLWPDILTAPRVLSMLFGVLIIIPFYLLIKLTFTETIAFYSCIILSLFPLHSIVSTFSMPDACFHFIFLSCLYFVFKFKLEEKKIIWLVLSAVLFNIAALLRFESWVFVPILSLLVFKEGKRYAVLFFCLSLIMPCLWMLLCNHFRRDAFYSFTTPARTAHMEILLHTVPYSKNIFGWLFVLGKMLGQGIVISGLIGIIYAFAKKRFFYLGLFFLYLYLLYTANTIAERMWYTERYGILWGLFLIPYSILCIEKISVFLKLKPVVLFLPFLLLSAGLFKPIAVRHLQGHTLPPEIKEIAGWLKKNVSMSDKILIGADKYDLYCQDIMVRSAMPPGNFFQVSILTPFPSYVKADILSHIAKQRPAYLILDSNGYLEEILSFDMRQEEVKDLGCTFKLVYNKYMFDGEKFNIYKIYY